MTQISRRAFIQFGGAGVGAALAPSVALASSSQANPGATNLPYPKQALVKADTLAINTALPFNYPDASSPCALIRMGHPVPGGIGPQQDIVAYSTLCTHMGCPVLYDAQHRVFRCPCHFSQFDSEKSGQMVIGQATENLPRIRLAYDEKTHAISAVGVEGLIYGRQANIL